MVIGNWEIKTYENGYWEVCCNNKCVHNKNRTVSTIPIPRNILKEMKKLNIS